MMRLFRHYIPVSLVLLAVTEAAILFFSMYAGVALRFVGGEHGDIESIGPVFPRALVFTAVMFTIMTSLGLYYRELKEEGEWGYYARFIATYAIGLIVMLLIFYSVPDLHLGRGAFTLVFTIAFMGTAFSRFVFTKFVDHDVLRRRVLLLGSGSRSAKVETLEKDALGNRKFNLVGCLPLTNTDRCINASRMLRDQGSILAIARKHRVDEIVVGVRERRNGGLPSDQLLECKLAGIDVIDLPSFFERETGQIQVESLNPSWMIFSDGFQRGSLRDMAKRVFDITVSTVLLLLTFPIMMVTMLLVFLESGTPIFYRQERVGEHGQNFYVLKFRSMRKDAEHDGIPQWAKKNDDRVTRVGRVIRKTRFDELPQIFNVLKGDMSFVGPRPERPHFVKELAKEVPYYQSRHTVKPGITGWAQIRYPYGATVEDAIQKLQYDLYYVKNRTLFLDLIILFQTAQVILFGKGAR
jgi:sugar transferase (PEP-CTERM system associated)